MADDTSDDVYDDPDNILADTDDDVDGAVELPPEQTEALSQSIYLPESEGPDDRGPIETDTVADDKPGDSAEPAPGNADVDGDETLTEIRELDDRQDIDAGHLSDVIPPAENDGTGD